MCIWIIIIDIGQKEATR